jgi:hypothetical protein
MRSLARLPLEGGGSILIEAPDGFDALPDGPVKAARLGDAIRELPTTVQAALKPVTDTAKVVLDQLREASPDEVEVEFGVDLATHAGAVIVTGEASGHFTVRMTWTGCGRDGDRSA